METPNDVGACFRDGQFAELAFLHAPIGLVVTENRVIRACNLIFAEMFGFEPDELKDQLFALLYPSLEEFSNIRDRGVDMLRRTNTYWDERIMAKKDGTLFWCRVRGQTFTPKEPLRRAVWSFADLSQLRPCFDLTRREREIISFLTAGLSSKEIARKLELSHRTIEVYRAKMLKKIGVSNTGQLLHALGDSRGTHVVPRD